MKLLIKFIKIIHKLNFVSKLPDQKKILIFDDVSFSDLKFVLKDYDFYLLKTRYGRIEELMINPKIILRSLIYYFKLKTINIWTAYLLTMIEYVSPKVVITWSDNSLKFFEIAKILNDKINFFAIQNGARYDLNRYLHRFEKGIHKTDETRKFFLPNFFCFGKYEIDDYKKKKIEVKNFIPVGSLRLANYIFDKKINVLKKKDILFDILIVSDAITQNSDRIFGTNGEVKRMAQFVKFIIKYSLVNKKKIIFSLKRLNSSQKNLEDEINFYKNNLNESEFSFFLKNSTINYKRYKYITYDLMLKSNVTISAYSTLIRENLSIGGKGVSINFMQNQIFDFPMEGICKITNCDYSTFEGKLNKIFSMSDKEFTNNLIDKNYLMKFDIKNSTIDQIRQEIKKFL